MNKVYDALVRVRLELVKRGWCQREFVDSETGEVCLTGAMNIVEYGCPISSGELGAGVWIQMHHMLTDVIGTTSLLLWNDKPDRTEGQVLAALDEAIARTTPRKGLT